VGEAAAVENQATEKATFTLSPNAWTTAFPSQSTQEQLNERLLARVQEIEHEVAVIREQQRVSLPSDSELASQPIDTPYVPTTFGRRMWCICRDIPLRIAFISFIKKLRSKAKKVRLRWLQGDRSRSFPTGLFPPSQPVLANLLPAYFRRSIAVT
jgi:hypothetical protein